MSACGDCAEASLARTCQSGDHGRLGNWLRHPVSVARRGRKQSGSAFNRKEGTECHKYIFVR